MTGVGGDTGHGKNITNLVITVKQYALVIKPQSILNVIKNL